MKTPTTVLLLSAVVASGALVASCADASLNAKIENAGAPLPTQGTAFVTVTEEPAASVEEPVVEEPVVDSAVAEITSEPEPDITAPIVPDPNTDLTAGSVAAGDIVDPNDPNHSGFTPLPRAFETDQLDEATGVPVLERDGENILVMAFSDIGYPEYIPRDPLLDGDDTDVEPHAFPQHLMKFDGRRVTIDGFMIPTSFRDGKVREFILSGDPPYCCFGGFPPIDRAIDITLPTDHPGVEYSQNGVMRVIGKLAVGETFDEYGYVLGIYKLHAETVAEEF